LVGEIVDSADVFRKTASLYKSKPEQVSL
jgi:hypothetical protein